jgi:hypothetical protein
MSARTYGLFPANWSPTHKIDPMLPISHCFRLDRILVAYATFANAANTGAVADVAGAKAVA